MEWLDLDLTALPYYEVANKDGSHFLIVEQLKKNLKFNCSWKIHCINEMANGYSFYLDVVKQSNGNHALFI